MPSWRRVVVTGLAALTSALALVAVGAPAWVAVPGSLLARRGMAVAQEHDERVRFAPDGVFVSALRSV